MRKAATRSDLSEPSLVWEDGSEPARRRAREVDAWVRDLTATAEENVSVVAVGGYGSGYLSPHSDIDLLFVTADDHATAEAVVRRVLYPLWDGGRRVGHALLSPEEAVARSAADVTALTALLHTRYVAGRRGPYDALIAHLREWIRKRTKQTAQRIIDAQRERHARVESAGWTLAPDLKQDRGGLRDVQAVEWLVAVAELTEREVPPAAAAARQRLAGARDTLLTVREALHLHAGRKLDRIHMELQPHVARRLGLEGDDATDELMTRVHTTARAAERTSSVAIEALKDSLGGGPRRNGFSLSVGEGVRLEDGALVTRAEHLDAAAALRLLAAVAETGRPLATHLIPLLPGAFERAVPAPWPAEVRASFLTLLRGNDPVSALWELDHAMAWPALLPEWQRIQGRAQHDPYHRFTVDAHSFLTLAEVGKAVEADPEARRAAADAGDLDSLRLAALLHDIGKGSGGDHSVEGAEIARAVCTRIGLDPGIIDEVVALVRHHLLLVDTATRRDLDDGSVVEGFARAVVSPRLLRLLFILTVADGRATSHHAWSDWKRSLVVELFHKALVALETGRLPVRSDVAARAAELESYEPALAGRVQPLLATLPPSYAASVPVPEMADEIRLLLFPPGEGEVSFRLDPAFEGGGDVVTVCTRDRAGTLAKTAGVLTLNRVPVRRAQTYSTTTGLVLQRFLVLLPSPATWKRAASDLQNVYAGRLALEPRVEEKARAYSDGRPLDIDVRILGEASAAATVVEVRCADALGLLYCIASALGDLDLDVRVAKVDTLGTRVVDVFYVKTRWGDKLDDTHAREVERAIRHRVARVLGQRVGGSTTRSE